MLIDFLQKMNIDIINNEIQCPIKECQIFLYSLGFFYLIYLIGQHFKNELCSFLNQSKFGFKNIHISIMIFLAPFLNIKIIALLLSIGVDEVVIKATEIGAVLLEFIIVMISSISYILISTLFILVLMLIYSTIGTMLTVIGGDIGIIVATLIVLRIYYGSFYEIINRITTFFPTFLQCIYKYYKDKIYD